MEKLDFKDFPHQVVILCGGLGTRLRPLTHSVPKPMVEVNNKPFLHYLIEQIRDSSGVTRILLLTGYKGELIQNYFNDGKSLGVEISYSNGPVEWDTGRRLWEARSKIEHRFLLLYSDNFVQFDPRRLNTIHKKSGALITLLLSSKKNGNIRISNDEIINSYDNTRQGGDFDYVEIGYMLVEKNTVFNTFQQCDGFPNISFSLVLKNLTENRLMAGMIVRDPYYSISDMERLGLMRQYLLPKKLLLMDRDGTINKKMPQGEYVTSWNLFEWIPDTVQAMKILAADGFQFIIITNQAGVARGMLNIDDLENIHKKMVCKLKQEGIQVLKVYVSPHHWEENSFYRKPNPGLFIEASKDFKLRMDHCLYIGDDGRDCEAAINAGCGMIYLSDSEYSSPSKIYPKPYLRAKTLLESVNRIKEIYAGWDA